MIKTRSCPRCKGAVLEYVAPEIDSPSCVNCGWRATDIPPDVQEQVEAHLGKPYSEERYIHSNIGTGKAPLSGWQRLKLRRARERAQRFNDNAAIA